MVTRKDVALRAGVSVATVSYVMNKSKHVTLEVQKRVTDAIEELGYRPNLLARGLATKETRHVAVLTDNLNNPHYCEMLSGAQAVASEHGYIVSVLSVDLSNPQDILDLASRGLDGVILALSNENPRIESIIASSLPTVRPSERVRINYDQAIADMLSHLLSLGHRRIAFLSGIPIASPEHVRFVAWKQAFAQHKLPLDAALIVDGLPSGTTDEAEGMRAMRELLARRVPFTAVYAVNDLMALGAMRVLLTSGLRVPQDISLVGCDRLKLLQSMTPTLASMDVQAFETGKRLMQLLIGKISSSTADFGTINVRYVPGESVGPAKEI